MWLLVLAIAMALRYPGCRDDTTFPERGHMGLTGRAESWFAFATFWGRRKMLFCRAKILPLHLPALASIDLKGRDPSPQPGGIQVSAAMLQLALGGGPEGLSCFPFCMHVTQKKIFFPNKNFSIPSVTNVNALLCPDPFFFKKKNPP